MNIQLFSRALRWDCPAVCGGLLACILAAVSCPAMAEPSMDGQWEEPPCLEPDPELGCDPWPLIAIHAAHQPNGQILVFQGNGTTARLWNSSDGAFTDVSTDAPVHLHCSGHAGLRDGSFLFAGGGSGGAVVSDADIFSIFTSPGPWSDAASMNFARWYPTCTSLGDGRVLAIAGTDDQVEQGGVVVPIPEIYDPVQDAWGTLGVLTTGIASTYPFMFLGPDGRVFFAGPGAQTAILDVGPPASWADLGNSTPLIGGNGSAVMYEPGWVLKCGGSSTTGDQTLTARIDLNDPSGTGGDWELVDSMAQARRNHNLVLLPDGKILAVGGEQWDDVTQSWQPVFSAEWFDPDPVVQQWTELALMFIPRWGHATAVLLPDAKVLVAGDIHPVGSSEYSQSAEIFSPPYLFWGPRPVIGYAPKIIVYGSDFRIATTVIGPQASEIDKVSLVRLGAVTHRFDENQRFVELEIVVQAASGLQVSAPANANLAPPGYYMLFVVSDLGVPSVARYVQLEYAVGP